MYFGDVAENLYKLEKFSVFVNYSISLLCGSFIVNSSYFGFNLFFCGVIILFGIFSTILSKDIKHIKESFNCYRMIYGDISLIKKELNSKSLILEFEQLVNKDYHYGCMFDVKEKVLKDDINMYLSKWKRAISLAAWFSR